MTQDTESGKKHICVHLQTTQQRVYQIQRINDWDSERREIKGPAQIPSVSLNTKNQRQKGDTIAHAGNPDTVLWEAEAEVLNPAWATY